MRSLTIALLTALLVGCGGGGGGGSPQQPPPPAAPTVTATISAATALLNTSVTIDWSSTNATTCGIAELSAANLAASGSRQVTASAAGQFTYTVQCTGAGGSASKAVTLSVAPAPTVSLSANPTSLTAGGSVTLAWSSTAATTCSASGGWTGAKQVSGGQTNANILASTTFTLTCTGPGGSASAEVSVTVATQITSWLDVNVRGVKLWMSNNPSSLFNEYLGQPTDTARYELWHDVLLRARADGATDVTFQLTIGVMQSYNDNQYLATNLNPPDASLIALAADARSLGLRVTVTFISIVQNVITGSGCCNDRPNPTDPAQWLQNTRLRVLEHARLARALDAYAMIFMTDETQHLVRDPALTNQWIQLIRDVRAEYAGKITTGWWTLGSGNSITTIPESIIQELDYLGIGLFPDLVRAEEPDLPALCSAYRSDADGNDVIAYLRGLSARYGKRIWITDKAFHSFKGASYDEWRIFGTTPLVPDEDLQARLYESFLAVMLRDGQGWLEGVSFQNFNTLRDGANPWPPRYLDGPLSESPQNKPSETVLSDWWNGRRTSGC